MKNKKNLTTIARSNGGLYGLLIGFGAALLLFGFILNMPALLALPLAGALSLGIFLIKVFKDFCSRKDLPEEVIEKVDVTIKNAELDEDWDFKLKNVKKSIPQSTSSKNLVQELKCIASHSHAQIAKKLSDKESELRKNQSKTDGFSFYSTPLNSENQEILKTYKEEVELSQKLEQTKEEKSALRAFIADQKNPGKATYVKICTLFQPAKVEAANKAPEATLPVCAPSA